MYLNEKSLNHSIVLNSCERSELPLIVDFPLINVLHACLPQLMLQRVSSQGVCVVYIVILGSGRLQYSCTSHLPIYLFVIVFYILIYLSFLTLFFTSQWIGWLLQTNINLLYMDKQLHLN